MQSRKLVTQKVSTCWKRILSAIHEQSANINQGVDRASKEEQGAYIGVEVQGPFKP